MQGAQIRSLVGELDPACHSEELMCHNYDQARPNKYSLKKKEETEQADEAGRSKRDQHKEDKKLTVQKTSTFSFNFHNGFYHPWSSIYDNWPNLLWSMF